MDVKPIKNESDYDAALAKIADLMDARVNTRAGDRLDVLVTPRDLQNPRNRGDDYNQQLSEHRATSVRDYLTGAGVAAASVTAKGLGKTLPVATNDTPTGRQQNRRVELVVSGEVIGVQIGTPPTQTPGVTPTAQAGAGAPPRR